MLGTMSAVGPAIQTERDCLVCVLLFGVVRLIVSAVIGFCNIADLTTRAPCALF